MELCQLSLEFVRAAGQLQGFQMDLEGRAAGGINAGQYFLDCWSYRYLSKRRRRRNVEFPGKL